MQGYGRDPHGLLELPDADTLTLRRAKAVSLLAVFAHCP